MYKISFKRSETLMGYEHNINVDQCVIEAIRRIVKAQNKVTSQNNCHTSCEESIKQLLISPTKRKFRYSTIPFILYKENLEPFIAKGIKKTPIKGYPEEIFYDCLETPILRAKNFIKNSNHCVVLELLRPANANGLPIADRGKQLCDFFRQQTPFKTIKFRHTGIYITIDLNLFAGIFCLDPINPLPINKSPVYAPSKRNCS